MNIQILSDLHIEFNAYNPDHVDSDVVIFAGDIHLGDKGFKWIQEHFKDKEVIYVIGNHELYKEATPRIFEKLKNKAIGTNIHILENESISIDGTTFLGCTLWTDFKLLDCQDVAIASANIQMTDYKKIRISPKYKKILPSYTVVWHEKSKKWIQNGVENNKGDKIVIITHHAPSINSIPVELRNDPISASYSSNMDDFVSNTNADLWVHGHIHTKCDYYIGRTRIVCNPRGYPDEQVKGFDPKLVIKI